MNRFLFSFFTILGGFFLQLLLDRYFSIYGAAPQLLLMLVVSIGFLHGPVMGESFGFIWGLLTDSMGVSLFGVNALVLTLVGYLSGKFRRRVASERSAGQLVISVIATLFYWVANSFLCSLFDEPKGAIPYSNVALEALLNIIFVSGIFWCMDGWLDFWRIEREHM